MACKIGRDNPRPMAEAVLESVPGSRAAGEKRKVVQRLEEGRHRFITLPKKTEDCGEWEEHSIYEPSNL